MEQEKLNDVEFAMSTGSTIMEAMSGFKDVKFIAMLNQGYQITSVFPLAIPTKAKVHTEANGGFEMSITVVMVLDKRPQPANFILTKMLSEMQQMNAAVEASMEKNNK